MTTNPTDQPRRPGRPRKYASNADRQRAYRQRRTARGSAPHQPPPAYAEDAERYSGPVYAGRIVVTADGREFFIGERVPAGEVPPPPSLPNGHRRSQRQYGHPAGLRAAVRSEDLAALLDDAGTPDAPPAYGSGVMLVNLESGWYAYGALPWRAPEATA
ncbi:hypothetical protein [Micromonospora sp. NPDC005254]|uniref:hypothetical protein n=1 Tax=Micromonospora sp. NPDC005254 TaxID=3364229 RepID=UPI0036C7C780